MNVVQSQHDRPGRLRVLHVASGDLWAGAEAQVFHLVRELIRLHTAEVGVVLLNEGELAKRLREISIPVWIFPERNCISPLILSRLVLLFRRYKPDLVHTHRAKENVLGSIAACLARVQTSIRTEHGRPEHVNSAKLSRLLARRVDKIVARHLQYRVVAVSNELRDFIATTFPGVRQMVIPNGIDSAEVREQSRRPPQPILAQTTYRICFVGRLVPVKRIDIFLRMAQHLLRYNPTAFRFYIIGDGPLKVELQRLAGELGIDGACEFLGFLQNCLPFVAEMDALVLTSDHEGMPMTALEALALGVPVVAHAVGGLVDLIDHPDRGALVSSCDPRDFAAAALRVLPRPPISDRAARRDLLQDRYTIRACAREYLDLYALATRSGDRVDG